METNYKKLYEDAIERAMNIRFSDHNSATANIVCEEIFPELKVSEDEKTRKSLIDFVEQYGDNYYGQTAKASAIAWLEKQGEKSTIIDVDQMVTDYSYTKDGEFGLPVNCMIRAYRKGINDVLKLSLNLEKQGNDYNRLVEEIKERKELLSKEKEKATSTNDKLSLGGRIAMLEELLAFTKEKQDEQKTITQYNYVKFREGDTVQKITGDKDIVTIAEVDIEAEEYKLTNTGFIPFKYEHLWHIVKQNPAWSKEDITNYSKVLFCLQTLTFPTDAERKELITWLKKQCEQSSADGECKAKREAELNPAWSDDDELRFKKAIYIFHQNGYFDVENWLKSLKDRVQPTWKPTEEQMEALDKVYKTHGADCECRHILLGLLNDLKKL